MSLCRGSWQTEKSVVRLEVEQFVFQMPFVAGFELNAGLLANARIALRCAARWPEQNEEWKLRQLLQSDWTPLPRATAKQLLRNPQTGRKRMILGASRFPRKLLI